MNKKNKVSLVAGAYLFLLAGSLLAMHKAHKPATLQQAVQSYERSLDFEFIEDFIDEGIEKNNLDFVATDHHGNNLLYWALKIDSRTIGSWNLSKIVQYAKAKQVDIKPLINAGNNFNITPFHCLVEEDMQGIAQDFLNWGADINVSHKSAATPLELLLNTDRRSYLNSLSMIIFLYSKGATVRSHYAALASPFMQAAYKEAIRLERGLYGDPLENELEHNTHLKIRLDAINFVSLMLERVNKKSYLNMLPEDLFGLAFGYAYNFYTNRTWGEYDPFKVLAKCKS